MNHVADLAQELGALFRSSAARPLRVGLPSVEAAYTVQAKAIEATGLRRIGTKIGATSLEAQRFLGCSGPIFGPIFTERVYDSGAHIELPASVLGLECEFGFSIGDPVTASPEAITEQSLMQCIAECFPVIEIAARRCPPEMPIDEIGTIADFCMAFAVVRGASIPDWRLRDLATTTASLRVDGAIAATGRGAQVLGHPLAPLVRLARTRARSGHPLQAGEIVITGSLTGVTPTGPGQTISAEFQDLPALLMHTRSASFTADRA